MPLQQADRPLSVTTALGDDALFVVGFSGREAISELFRFDLDLIAENRAEIPFDKLLGQPASVRVRLPDATHRYFNGIVSRLGQGGRDELFTQYRAEVVPQFWLLTKRTQSRIFQQMGIPEILARVLEGLSVDIQLKGQYLPRDYCVQYRESDFAFASRLMEEEGIFYFFLHDESSHSMIVTDDPQSFFPRPLGAVRYDELSGGARETDRIRSWQKVQELGSGKVTLWDHCFELPGKHLEAEQLVVERVRVGSVDHRLKIGRNDRLELYEYPGGYAQRFDGVDPAGGERPDELQAIFEDNKRTAAIRMQQEAVANIVIQGGSDCRDFSAGITFELREHFDADGAYVLTSVEHSARLSGNYRSSDTRLELAYQNTFTCVPEALPFRPRRKTPRPVMQGMQSAVVVGPPGEEIFTDKYGRVKAQFAWDREGQLNEGSSCWIRVATSWAGKQWGVIHIPRIGQEVVVAFEEGDPDRPIIVGSVYNAEQMPPHELPAGKVNSGTKSRTHKGGGYNGVDLDDTKGKEMFAAHAQYDMTTKVGHNSTISVVNDMSTSVGHNESRSVGNDDTLNIKGKHTAKIDGNTSITILTGTYSHSVATGTGAFHVKGAVTEDYDATQATTVNGDITITSKTGKITLKAATEILLVVGASKLLLKSDGSIELKGKDVAIDGKSSVNVHGRSVTSKADADHNIEGNIVMSTAQAANTVKGGMVMLNP